MTMSNHAVGAVAGVTDLLFVSEQRCSPPECQISQARGEVARLTRLIADLPRAESVTETRLISVYVGGRQRRSDDSRMTAGSQ